MVLAGWVAWGAASARADELTRAPHVSTLTMRSDQLGQDIRLGRFAQGVMYSAALLGWVGAGYYVHELRRAHSCDDRVCPDDNATARFVTSLSFLLGVGATGTGIYYTTLTRGLIEQRRVLSWQPVATARSVGLNARFTW